VIEAIAVIALGVAAGIVAGLFGVGGGIIFVPTLTVVLGLSQLEAEATSLLAIIPVALLGTYRQASAGTVRWRDALVLGLASVATAVAGALIADAASDRVLRVGFALLLVVTALQLVLRARRGEEPTGPAGPRPRRGRRRARAPRRARARPRPRPKSWW
jgi:uncharacterized membrane protein YfcA